MTMIKPISRLLLLLVLWSWLWPADAQSLRLLDEPEGDEALGVQEEPLLPVAERPDGPPRVPLAEIRRYVGVYRAVRDAYVEQVDEQALMQAAIRGLLTDLDPHSAYLDHDQTQAMDEMATGAYDGIGLELIQQPDRSLLVIAPIDDTPAARAGFKPGDIIVAIDGQPIQVDSVDEAVTELRGPPGSQIALTVLREGERQPMELTVVRETIRITSVRARLLEPGYGYLRISTFQTDTSRSVREKLTELAEPGALHGLVLDLRSNPGGLLNAAVESADTFLDAALLDNPVIVSTKGRLPFANSEFRARPGDLLAGAPIVVLVDSGSASASEVLAGALRDHRRALIMGERTFGKGSVQTVIPMDNGDAIKLTTARYYTPSGRSIQATGITPDIAVADRASASAGDRPPSLRERDLPGHLIGELEPEPVDGDADQSAPGEEDIEDQMVLEALNVLKGLAVLKPRSKG